MAPGATPQAPHTQTPPSSSPDPLPLKGPLEPLSVSPLLAVEIPERLDAYAREAKKLNGMARKLMGYYQTFIRGLETQRNAEPGQALEDICTDPTFEKSYTGMKESWERYHRQAREVRNLFRGIEAYDRAGYSEGLRPDIRKRLKSTVTSYQQIRQEHIEFRALLAYQVDAEARRLNCKFIQGSLVAAPSLSALEEASKAPGPRTKTPERAVASGSGGAETTHPGEALHPSQPDDDADSIDQIPAGPSAGESPSPGGDSTAAVPTDSSPQETTTPNEGAEPDWIDNEAEGVLPGEKDMMQSALSPQAPDDGEAASSQSAEKSSSSPQSAVPPAVPPNSAAGTPAGTGTLEPSSPSAPGTDGSAETQPSETESIPSPTPELPPPSVPPDLAVAFTIDNRQCSREFSVYLDGRFLGKVQGGTLVSFTATEGSHSLCLTLQKMTKPCEDPSSLIDVTLYEGFALKPRC